MKFYHERKLEIKKCTCKIANGRHLYVLVRRCRSSHYSALPAKRLWHYLVQQENLHQVFIRYVFKKRDIAGAAQVSWGPVPL